MMVNKITVRYSQRYEPSMKAKCHEKLDCKLHWSPKYSNQIIFLKLGENPSFTYLYFYKKILIFTGREGTLGCLLHWFPKFYNNVFLFVGLTTLGTLIKL